MKLSIKFLLCALLFSLTFALNAWAYCEKEAEEGPGFSMELGGSILCCHFGVFQEDGGCVMY